MSPIVVTGECPVFTKRPSISTERLSSQVEFGILGMRPAVWRIVVTVQNETMTMRHIAEGTRLIVPVTGLEKSSYTQIHAPI